jgi:hypothetical protein
MSIPVSRDGGKTIENQLKTIYFGAYFFVAEDRRVHRRDAFTIFDLLAKIGGLFSIIKIMIKGISKQINMEAIVISVAQQTFYCKSVGYNYGSLYMDCLDWINYPMSMCCKMTHQ